MAQPTLDQWAKSLIAKIQKVAENAVDETVVESANVMRRMIRTRGTNKPWAGYYIGRSGIPRNHSGVGRIDSGFMLASVDAQSIVDTRSKYTGEFGWLGGDVYDYFLKQEKGFTVGLTNVAVEPMNALRDSFTYATVTVVDKVKKGLSSI
jgi:hypothetical protein